MKWPWTSRVDEAKERAAEARRGLDRVRSQWEDVRTVVGTSRDNRFSEDHLLTLFREGRRNA